MERQLILIAGGGPGAKQWAAELRKGGFLVRETSRGEEALRVLEADRPGLVVASMEPPSRAGIELIEGAKASVAGVTVIAVTGPEDDAGAQLATRAGADEVLGVGAPATAVLASARRLLACDDVTADDRLGAGGPLQGC